MPIHNFSPLRGQLVLERLDAPSLRGNRLGDPSERTVAVYLPPEALTDKDALLPLIIYLAPYTGSGLKNAGWKAFGESLPQRVERLQSEGKMGPSIVALPDTFTSLGGNQFLNSSIAGNWEDFILEDLIAHLESRFPVLPGANHRAVVGFSSGGYGALMHGLRHGDQWAAVACHSGDMGFELLYRGEFPNVLLRLAKHGGDIGQFFQSFRAAKKARGSDFFSLMVLGQSAFFDPEIESHHGLRLPVDPVTCEIRPERWKRWLAHDPVELAQDAVAQEQLRQLKLLYLDCGKLDPYNLQFGARTFAKRLREAGVKHTYEEFSDDHSGVDYRLDESLPRLWSAIR